MKGFVKNISHLWAHVMKRAVAPGAQIPLEELYEQYGKKHGLCEGDEFVRWLYDVKLRDREKWQILDENGLPYFKQVNYKKEETGAELKAQVELTLEDVNKKSSTNKSRGENVTPPVPKKMTVDDITNLTFRQAKEVIRDIMDITLLRYAAHQANQMAGKDSLCRLLRKRIQELEISTRR